MESDLIQIMKEKGKQVKSMKGMIVAVASRIHL